MIYIIGAPELGNGRVKIGYTGRPVRFRLAALQTGSPCLLFLRAEFEGTESIERNLHEYFAKERLHSEWFEFGLRDAVAEVSALLDREKSSPGVLRDIIMARKIAERRQYQKTRHQVWRDAIKVA